MIEKTHEKGRPVASGIQSGPGLQPRKRGCLMGGVGPLACLLSLVGCPTATTLETDCDALWVDLLDTSQLYTSNYESGAVEGRLAIVRLLLPNPAAVAWVEVEGEVVARMEPENRNRGWVAPLEWTILPPMPEGLALGSFVSVDVILEYGGCRVVESMDVELRGPG